MVMQSPNSAPVPAETLTNKSQTMLERLDRCIDRSRNIVDRLHGARPRDAGAAAVGGPQAMPSIDRYLDLMHERMGEIEDELARADGRI